RPKTVRGFGGVPIAKSTSAPADVAGDLRGVLRAWSPYIVIVLIVVAWTGPWSRLPAYSLLKLSVSGVSSISHQPFAQTYNLHPLSVGSARLRRSSGGLG